MSKVAKSRWEKMKTAETRMVEELLRQHFEHVDAYRYNSASVRIRIVDSRFEGKSAAKRGAMVEPILAQLPENTQADIMNLTTLSPDEPNKSLRAAFTNSEFEDPSPSIL